MTAAQGGVKTIVRMPARETQPRVLVVRKRTVANVDSIGFVVRMCSQCSAGYVLQNISPLMLSSNLCSVARPSRLE
jgi:hypothetical protein